MYTLEATFILTKKDDAFFLSASFQKRNSPVIRFLKAVLGIGSDALAILENVSERRLCDEAEKRSGR